MKNQISNIENLSNFSKIQVFLPGHQQRSACVPLRGYTVAKPFGFEQDSGQQ
jgi:hypothetical protein